MLHFLCDLLERTAHVDSASAVGVFAWFDDPDISADAYVVVSLNSLIFKVREVVWLIWIEQVTLVRDLPQL